MSDKLRNTPKKLQQAGAIDHREGEPIFAERYSGYADNGLFVCIDGDKSEPVRLDIRLNQDEMLKELLGVVDSKTAMEWFETWGLPIKGNCSMQNFLGFASEIRWLASIVEVVRNIEGGREAAKAPNYRKHLDEWCVEDRAAGCLEFFGETNYARVSAAKCLEIAADAPDVLFMTLRPTAIEFDERAKLNWSYDSDIFIASRDLKWIYDFNLRAVRDLKGLESPCRAYPVLVKTFKKHREELTLTLAKTFVQDCINFLLGGMVYQIGWEFDELAGRFVQCPTVQPSTQVEAIALALSRRLTKNSNLRFCPHPDCGVPYFGKSDKLSCGKPRCQRFVSRHPELGRHRKEKGGA